MRRAFFHLSMSLAILVNSFGVAQASMRMAFPDAAEPAPTQATPAQEHHDAQPCHETASPSVPAEGIPGDCCASSTCTCGCIGQLQLALTAPLILASGIAHASDARSMSLGRPAPTLPHLIRPPIA